MQVEKPSLHPMARAGLVEIQSAGVEITPEIVLWVQEAAVKIGKIRHRPVSDLIDWPVQCGGATLYRLSFGAVEWMQGLPERLRMSVATIGFACAHSHDLARLMALRGTLAATAAILKWVSGLTCSMDALAATVDDLIGSEQYEEIKESGTRKPGRDRQSWEWGALIRAACQKYSGTTPEYWMWQVSREQVYEMLREVNSELPDSQQVTDYEIESNILYRSVIDHIKGGANV